MASFLFWNLFRNRLEDRIARLAVAHDIDVLMLAEFEPRPSEVISAIESAGGGRFHVHGMPGQKVWVFSRLQESALVETFRDVLGRMRISRMYLEGRPEMLLAVVHFPSLRNRSREGAAQSATFWARDVKEKETEVGHRRTVLVGDLNMNPFDAGVISGHGLHAVMTRAKAMENDRRVDGEPSPFFYNPMWGFFGDRTPGPPGTYYLSATDPVNYFWNVYDQVMVRPELIPLLKNVAILDNDGVESLLTAGGLPKKSGFSDHLPLMFRLAED